MNNLNTLLESVINNGGSIENAPVVTISDNFILESAYEYANSVNDLIESSTMFNKMEDAFGVLNESAAMSADEKIEKVDAILHEGAKEIGGKAKDGLLKFWSWLGSMFDKMTQFIEGMLRDNKKFVEKYSQLIDKSKNEEAKYKGHKFDFKLAEKVAGSLGEVTNLLKPFSVNSYADMKKVLDDDTLTASELRKAAVKIMLGTESDDAKKFFTDSIVGEEKEITIKKSDAKSYLKTISSANPKKNASAIAEAKKGVKSNIAEMDNLMKSLEQMEKSPDEDDKKEGFSRREKISIGTRFGSLKSSIIRMIISLYANFNSVAISLYRKQANEYATAVRQLVGKKPLGETAKDATGQDDVIKSDEDEDAPDDADAPDDDDDDE